MNPREMWENRKFRVFVGRPVACAVRLVLIERADKWPGFRVAARYPLLGLNSENPRVVHPLRGVVLAADVIAEHERSGGMVLYSTGSTRHGDDVGRAISAWKTNARPAAEA